MNVQTRTAETAATALTALSTATPNFALSIRRGEKSGRELRRVPVPEAYLRDFRFELLRNYAMRRGMPAATLDEMTIQMTPIYEGNFCRGIRVDVRNPRGESFGQEYNVRLFSDVADAALQRLIADKVLTLDDKWSYELVVDDRPAARATTVDTAVTEMSFSTDAKPAPLKYLSRPLKHLRQNAEAVGEPSDLHFPVLYTASAYERSQRFARRGGESQPPRETGAILVGPPCSCPETGEFYLVVTDALEATDAEEKKLSLAFTGKTWLRLQAIVKSMQAQPATSTYRFLGQSHGHNFVPMDGAPPCAICATTKVCSRTSVMVSHEDRVWTQAVFSGAPYALCHIFGLNARLDKVHGLYSLHENRLTQRGFYIIPDFDPTSE